MKYKLTRKINLKRFFPEMEYENVEFCVEDCDSREEADLEINNWIKDFINKKKK